MGWKTTRTSRKRLIPLPNRGYSNYFLHSPESRDNDWDESATWNTQPRAISPFQLITTIGGSINWYCSSPFLRNSWHEIDLTNLFINAWKAFKSPRSSKIISFSFRGNDDGSLSCFLANESPSVDKRPQLNVIGTL